MSSSIARYFDWLTRIGADPADDNDARLQKSLLVVCALPFAFIGFGWGLLYFAFGEYRSGWIPFLYGVFSWFSIIYFAITRRYGVFRVSQLGLILILPFLLMLSLGGFVAGSAVVLWALISPMGAMLFGDRKSALRWLYAFLALVVLAAILETSVQRTNNLSATAITFFFVINLTGVASLTFLMVYFFVGQKNIFQEQSENLLLNILPKPIAEELKRDHHTIAEQYAGASVLFADLVDFTPLSAKLNAHDVVRLLNDVFSEFDDMVDGYGLEKIKTIGDCYMVASGVPERGDDHAQALTDLALDMQDCVDSRTFDGHKIAFRIGINSGPIVAGVIGRRKFIYDLWGDAVNTASRMESHGVGGRIQITSVTRALIGDDCICESRGLIEVKGKGPINTWFVKGRREGRGSGAVVGDLRG